MKYPTLPNLSSHCQQWLGYTNNFWIFIFSGNIYINYIFYFAEWIITFILPISKNHLSFIVSKFWCFFEYRKFSILLRWCKVSSALLKDGINLLSSLTWSRAFVTICYYWLSLLLVRYFFKFYTMYIYVQYIFIWTSLTIRAYYPGT
jgi:hypothetical protein